MSTTATSASSYVVMERNADLSSYSGLSGGTDRNNEQLLVFEGADAAASLSANDATSRGSLPTTLTALAATIRTPESRKRRLQEYVKSYDFVELVVCTLWYLSSFVVPSLVIGSNQRPIPYQYLDGSNEYVRNLVNNEDLQGSTVSVAMLILLGVILPLGMQLAASVMWGRTGDVQATLCAHLVAQGTTQCATESVKRYVGYLRPIFYAACAPSDDYQACTSTDDRSVDVRKSFPSGHSSTAFCGLALLTLYLHHRLGMGSIRPVRLNQIEPRRLDSPASQDESVALGSDPPLQTDCQRCQRPILHYRFVSFVSMIFPMGLASFIACSRVVNNKHFPADVVGGAGLGLGIAVYVNGLWWRPNNVWGAGYE